VWGAPPHPIAAPVGDPTLRARAMVACGALKDPALLPKYEAYLFPKVGPMPKDNVAIAAAFGVARIQDKKAIPLAHKLVESFETLPVEMRVYGALALGRTKDKAHIPALEAFLKRSDAQTWGRAAAVYALGEIGDPSSKATITNVVETSTEVVARQSAILALARMMVPAAKGKKAAVPVTDASIATFAEAALDGNERLRKAASIALAALATGEFRAVNDSMPVPEGMINSESAIAALVPNAYGPADFAAALVAHEKVISSAVSTALQTSKERSIVALDAMLARPGGVAFGIFTTGAPPAGKPPEKFGPALDAAGRIANAAEAFVAGLVHHPELAVQTRAVRWLGRRETPGARDALVDALSEDRAVDVQRLALEELSRRGDATSVTEIAQVLSTHKQWSVRADAARALGEIGKRDAKATVAPPLEKAASSDKYAFVRELALKGLALAGRPGAKAVLEKAAKDDPEPRVRELATTLLKGA